MSNEIPTDVNQGTRGTSYRLRRFFGYWPLLIWGVALVLVVYLYTSRGSYSRVNGMVYTHMEEIAPPTDGVILEVHVREGEKVKKGQTIVKLDPALIQKQIDDYKANLPYLRADMKRKFQSERFGINADLQRAIADKNRIESRIKVAQRQVDFLQAELKEGRASLPQVMVAQNELETVTGEAGIYDGTIAELRKDLQAADDMISGLDDIEIPEELLALKQQLADKTLLAPADGTVQKVHKMRGVARTGEAILTLIPDHPDPSSAGKMVRGFVDQNDNPEELQVGATVWVSQDTKNPIAYPVKIISVAPDISAVQNYSTPVPGQFFRGREFLCELPPDLYHLIPNTRVHIHRDEPGKFDIWSFGKTPVKAASN